ncbi:histidine biosynthesis trifunctional protein [Morchella conica CCBAS932]|uniref:Histidine biosynthesis trifunctional protein n=1 Tax=Morchella conica CCBAS932 TaxID=1392247 RepID=A0A3N4KZE8_9PEZI|nr:histidine biosynthesis trifunctional protein [Morchella conica CCBAS932]
MSLPLIAAIDPFTSPSSGLSPSTLSHISQTLLTVTPDTLPQALEYISAHTTTQTISVNVTSLLSTDAIHSLLDAGATRLFATYEQLSTLQPLINDDSRLALLLDTAHTSKDTIVSAISDTSVGIYAHKVTDIDAVAAWLTEYGTGNHPPVYVSFAAQPALADVVRIAKLAAVPILDSAWMTVDGGEGLLGVAEVVMAGVVSDREDGLVTTLVVDERGVALGLVYSSLESVRESIRTGSGVYQSRKRGLWYKGATSGATQELVRIDADCDADCLRFVVRQKGSGFCHLETATCFGAYTGLSHLQKTLQARKESAPAGSYTARLFSDAQLLRAKILEEAEELCDAKTKDEIAFEAADLFYFALTRCVAAGVDLADVEKNLDKKALKVSRRKGDAKPKFLAAGEKAENGKSAPAEAPKPAPAEAPKPAETPAEPLDPNRPIKMKRIDAQSTTPEELETVLRRPAQKTNTIMSIVTPIIDSVRTNGDSALISLAQKFDRATLTSPVLRAPFPDHLMALSPETKAAIDLSFANIHTFHAAQAESEPLTISTMPGVRCSRFVRPIERVGLYVPGGTAVLPSTALMLGVPAMVAGCSRIVLATPARPDGTVTPEIVYVAHKVGAECIVLAGGAQAVAAMAYGTESVPKVDKILGPGNQFVTAGKMYVSNDTSAGVSIDMPAGPSEVLVIADRSANPAFVASDLLSQAEHGVDSQVVLIAVGLDDAGLEAIEEEVHKQAVALPRVEIVRGAIEHSVTLRTATIEEAVALSNTYAPEHLILQVENAAKVVEGVVNAGSVFVGMWTPESVGDYSAGVNHSLPTYGYARQYSGVNLSTFVKHITSSELTEEGLRNVGGAVMQLAKVEELEAHRRAVEIRLEWADKQKENASS